MLRLNKKGQASSTFQLLIAAVVALAILGVLLSLLNVIPGPNADPSKSTKTLLRSQMDSPGAEMCTTSVTFTRSVSRVAAESITADTGLDPSQVYFDNPEEISSFSISETKRLLKYDPTTSRKVIMCVICSNTIENLGNAIADNKKETDIGFYDLGSVSTTASPTDFYLIDNQAICVVYPRKTATS